MPSKKLTAVAIPSLGVGEWYDQGLAGLILRVGVRRRTWYFRYHANGSYQRKPLGHFPAVQLADAREAARALIDRADRGVPPQAPAPHPRSADVLTLGGLIDKYEDMRRREGRKTKTLDQAMRLIRRNLEPYLTLPADQFSKADLRAARDAMVDADAMIAANRLLQRLGPVLRWAAQEDLIPVNFVPAIRKAAEVARTRKLTDAEIRRVWKACDDRSFGRLVRFLLVTAQRRGEAAALKHGHILGGVWRLTDNKSSRPHSLTLPPLAMELLGHGGARDFVFGAKQMIGFSTAKRVLDAASGVTGWRLHDLRRTAATNLQELGVRNEVVSAILNHALPGVTGVYLRSELEKEKADALALWANALMKIVGRAAA